jgi:hypothetical protein
MAQDKQYDLGYTMGKRDRQMYGTRYGLRAIARREGPWAEGYRAGYEDAAPIEKKRGRRVKAT